VFDEDVSKLRQSLAEVGSRFNNTEGVLASIRERIRQETPASSPTNRRLGHWMSACARSCCWSKPSTAGSGDRAPHQNDLGKSRSISLAIVWTG